MNCPKCGKPMESGTMYADKYPYWTQQKNLPVFRTPKDKVILRPLGDTLFREFFFPLSRLSRHHALPRLRDCLFSLSAAVGAVCDRPLARTVRPCELIQTTN